MNELKTVDGAGSGLDADLLDGKHASEFALKGDDIFTRDMTVGKEDFIVNQTQNYTSVTRNVYTASKNCFGVFLFYFPNYKDYRYCSIFIDNTAILDFGNQMNFGTIEHLVVPAFLKEGNILKVATQTQAAGNTTFYLNYYVM